MSKQYKLPKHHPECFSFNEDGSQCVVAVECDLIIFDLSKGTPAIVQKLQSHKHRVTGVDWCGESNQIVSCGEDRNAYVYSLKDGSWTPTLVVLRCNRAALCVKWSPGGKKFAVGTSMKTVMVCNYDSDHDFWVSKSIKKFKSSVLCLDWDPSGKYLAAGGSTMKCHVVCAYVDDVDEGGCDHSFGEQVKEFPSLGFVLAVKYSGDGKKLAFSSQSAQITIVNTDDFDDAHTTQLATRPMKSICFKSDDSSLMCGGFDKSFYEIPVDGTKLGKPSVVEVKKVQKKAKNAAFAKFQQQANLGRAAGAKKKGSETSHTFAITCVGPTNAVKDQFATVANGDRFLNVYAL